MRMDVNKALTCIGQKNYFILKWFFLINLMKSMPSAFSTFAFMFAGMNPDTVHCKLPPGLNVSYLPTDPDQNGVAQLSQCVQYTNNSAVSPRVPCQNGYTYTNKWVQSSIVTEFDLVCDRSLLKEVATSSYFGLSIFGAFVFCGLADRFGRRPVFISLILGMATLMTITIFLPNIESYIFVRALTGLFQDGLYNTGYCMVIELFPLHTRTKMGMATQLFWTGNSLLLVAIAYFVRDWRYFFAAITSPFIIFIPICWFLPESIFWLVSHGDVDKAKSILMKAAESNKTTTTLHNSQLEDVFSSAETEPTGITVKNRNKSTPIMSHRGIQIHYSMTKLVQHPLLLRFILVSIILWFSVALSFYGIQLKAMQLQNPYLVFTLSTIVEIPAYIFFMFFIDKFGRKYPLAIMYSMTSVSLLVAYLLNKYVTFSSWPTTVVLMFGRFLVSGIFGTIFLYTSELFPTTLRTVALGISSGAGRIGVALSPLLMKLGSIYPNALWSVLISVNVVCSFLIILLLVETRFHVLPETIEEIEAWVWKEKKTADIMLEVEDENAD